jgi:hypothetical protein
MTHHGPGGSQIAALPRSWHKATAGAWPAPF